MIVDLLLVLAGLALLVVGGDAIVKGAVNLALRLGLSPLVVGLTVVAFGTSAPELLVSVSAALSGATDIALGNVVGSNIANVLLILGATALVMAIDPRKADLRESWAMMIAATVLVIALAFVGPIGRLSGVVLLIALALILTRQIMTGRVSSDDEMPEGAELGARWVQIAIWLGIGIVALPIGAHLLVTGAADIARLFGLSEAVIGLTLVAIGTSLPELAASVASALRGRSDLALGNVVGSNIFNLLAILGLTSMVDTLPVPEQMLRLDVWVMLVSALLLGPILWRGVVIGRAMGAVLLAAYAVYIGALL